ncbi:MAG: Tol-Pal system beta propeller repeat protein TolB, partial [Deltaproteobacteria bacterium]|nr:Tol-Pal system beta propeller repeat protein TolB [Deltaproteobacteria bacterium]
MFKNRFKTLICFTVALVFILPDLCCADYDYIDINSPSMRKIPLAIPVFKSIASNSTEARFSKKASDLLAETLDFTGYLNIQDRKA